MGNEQAKELIVTWMKDAHAMERTLEKMLTKQADHAEADAALRTKLVQHRDETKRHAEMVEGALKRYGEDPSGFKDMAGKAEAAIMGMMSGAAGDTVIKDVLSGIASEHFEIACYRSLQAAAQSLGDGQTERMCEEILRDEERMAQFLESQLSRVTQMELAEATL